MDDIINGNKLINKMDENNIITDAVAEATLLDDTNGPLNENDVYLLDATEQAVFDHKSAKELQKHIPLTMKRDYLIKPLPVQELEVEKDVPVPTGEIDKETGAKETKIEKRVEKVPSPVQEGIIIGLPEIDPFSSAAKDTTPYVLGEHVVFSSKVGMTGIWKDSIILNSSQIIARVKPDHVAAFNDDIVKKERAEMAREMHNDAIKAERNKRNKRK